MSGLTGILLGLLWWGGEITVQYLATVEYFTKGVQ